MLLTVVTADAIPPPLPTRRATSRRPEDNASITPVISKSSADFIEGLVKCVCGGGGLLNWGSSGGEQEWCACACVCVRSCVWVGGGVWVGGIVRQ